jgi:hypothetical protein
MHSFPSSPRARPSLQPPALNQSVQLSRPAFGSYPLARVMPRSDAWRRWAATRYDHSKSAALTSGSCATRGGNEFCVLHPNFPDLLAWRRPGPT